MTDAAALEIQRKADEIYARTGVRPARLRCGMRTYHAVLSYAMDTVPPGPSSPRPMGPFGLDLVDDRWLPPEVWRLTDEHDTLLFDCREGS